MPIPWIQASHAPHAPAESPFAPRFDSPRTGTQTPAAAQDHISSAGAGRQPNLADAVDAQFGRLHVQPKARPERDVTAEFMKDLDAIPGRSAFWARSAAKNQWLSGDFSNSTTRATLQQIRDVHGHKDPRIAAAADKALAQVPPEAGAYKPSLKEYHANPHGRAFESRLVQKMVEDPTPESFRAATKQMEIVKPEMTRLLGELPPHQQQEYLRQLAGFMKADERQWAHRTPQLANFTDAPSAQTFSKLFNTPETGHDIIAGQYATVKAGIAMNKFGKPQWMANANSFYPTIGATRTTHMAPQQYLTPFSGIQLADQHAPPYHIPQMPGKLAQSWSDAKIPDFQQPSAFERRALYEGHPVVNGASGSTNILSHLNNEIAREDPSFDTKAAMGNTMMFLTYDGGHSLNEAMAVDRALDAKNNVYAASKQYPGRTQLDEDATHANRKNAIDEHRLNYNDLPNLYAGSESREQLERQMRDSMHETISQVPSTNFQTYA